MLCWTEMMILLVYERLIRTSRGDNTKVWLLPSWCVLRLLVYHYCSFNLLDLVSLYFTLPLLSSKFDGNVFYGHLTDHGSTHLPCIYHDADPKPIVMKVKL